MKQSATTRTPSGNLNVDAGRLKNARFRLHLPHCVARYERRAWEELLAGPVEGHHSGPSTATLTAEAALS
jgi:hypothetical protein